MRGVWKNETGEDVAEMRKGRKREVAETKHNRKARIWQRRQKEKRCTTKKESKKM